MDSIQKYAPILHTAFDSGYTGEQMQSFVAWCDAQGFSGFSTEGKANPRTNDVDAWIEGFMQGLRHAVAEAEKAGLDVWLFDEWGYPTGTAAGKTMEHHTEWRSKKLHLTADIPLEQGQTVKLDVPPHFLAAAAWKTGRDIFASPLSEAVQIEPVDGIITYTATHKRERFCAVSWEYDSFRTVGVFVPDPEDDKQGTLDLLCAEAVAHFLTQMHEVHYKALGDYFGKVIKGFFYDEPFVSVPTPYTFDIFEQFKKGKGYDILPMLPQMMAGAAPQILLDYRDVCTTRVAEAFYRQMADWCHKHGVETVGHQDLDHRVRSLDSTSGHFFKNSAQSDAPGVDYIWAQLVPGTFADFPRFAGSARRIMGKKHAISESFAAAGQNLYPDYMRFCMEHQIIRGIDRFFLMIADPVSANSCDVTPLSRTHPQSKAFGAALNRRVARTNWLVNNSQPVGGVALYLPMPAIFEQMLRQGHSSAVNYAPFAPVWKYIEEAAAALAHMPVDFDYLWREALLSLPVVNGALQTPHGMRIHTVIVPPVVELERGLADRLSELLKAGVRIIFLNSPPAEFLEQGEICPTIRELTSFIEPDLTVKGISMLSLAHRRCEDGRELFFLLNEDSSAADATIEFPQSGLLQRFDYDREAWIDLGGHGIEAHFEGMQTMVFSVGGNPTGITPLKTEEISGITDWTAVTPDGKDIPLENGLVDWRSFYPADYSGWMTYRAEFEIAASGNYRIDLGRVCWAARVTVGKTTQLAAFAPCTTDFELEAGRHTVTVEVLNTPANAFIGTPEAVRANLESGWMKTKVGNDRNYLVSGLLGPVTLYRLT